MNSITLMKYVQVHHFNVLNASTKCRFDIQLYCICTINRLRLFFSKECMYLEFLLIFGWIFRARQFGTNDCLKPISLIILGVNKLKIWCKFGLSPYTKHSCNIVDFRLEFFPPMNNYRRGEKRRRITHYLIAILLPVQIFC